MADGLFGRQGKQSVFFACNNRNHLSNAQDSKDSLSCENIRMKLAKVLSIHFIFITNCLRERYHSMFIQRERERERERES